MEGETKGSWFDDHRGIVIFIGVFLVLAVVAIMVFVAFKMLSAPKKVKEVPVASEQKDPLKEALNEKPDVGTLPVGDEILEGNGNGNGEFADWEVEKFGFGDFYESPSTDIEIGFDDIVLPINVKVNVANYHDVNRKIDLEAGVDSLNNNGFAVLGNPFSKEADDFYTIYDYLDKKQLPTLVTADFLLYYYQNVLKSVYKEIESTTFYDNLWETNLKLYKLAKARYEEHREEAGVENDPTLEAERLELTFFATALELLQPMEEQINREATLEATDMFSIGEANYYNFQLPSYLKDNVLKEVGLIRTGEGEHKSPILLYVRDYGHFQVPEEYLDSSRLKNFYLASQWLNSTFPLYYRSDECSTCLLDQDDWRINFYAAILLAEDFSNNQDLQNRWAKIYKLKSFFSGLRGDLTYLHYNNVFESLFGENEKAVDVFSGDESDIDAKLLDMQKALAEYRFLEIEGAIDKTATATKPFLGMKMLSESYWPNDYIIRELTYPKVGAYQEAVKLKEVDVNFIKTVCDTKKELGRCYFSAYDVVNLIYPMSDINSYFAANTRYENYDRQKEYLESQLRDFSSGSWHSNNYWSIIDISRKFLETPEEQRPAYARNEAWVKRKIDTVIGSWVNLQVEADILTTYKETGESRLNQVSEDNQFAEYRYIEPNLVLVSELRANTEMLLSMFSLLDITEKDNEAVSKLKVMKKDLDMVEAIVKKEMAGEDLSDDDYKFITAFPKEYSVKRAGDKKMEITSPYSKKILTESVEGVKLMVLIYKKDDKNIFAVGPVFNFWESKK